MGQHRLLLPQRREALPRPCLAGGGPAQPRSADREYSGEGRLADDYPGLFDSQRNARMLPRTIPATRPMAKPTIRSEVTGAAPRKRSRRVRPPFGRPNSPPLGRRRSGLSSRRWRGAPGCEGSSSVRSLAPVAGRAASPRSILGAPPCPVTLLFRSTGVQPQKLDLMFAGREFEAILVSSCEA